MDNRSERYYNLYKKNIKRISRNSSPYINSFREAAIEEFNRLGLPTKANENYRYTNLDTFFNHDYKSYFMPVESDFIKAEEFRCDVTDLDAHGIVLLNGFYPTIRDKLRQLPEGIWSHGRLVTWQITAVIRQITAVTWRLTTVTRFKTHRRTHL